MRCDLTMHDIGAGDCGRPGAPRGGGARVLCQQRAPARRQPRWKEQRRLELRGEDAGAALVPIPSSRLSLGL